MRLGPRKEKSGSNECVELSLVSLTYRHYVHSHNAATDFTIIELNQWHFLSIYLSIYLSIFLSKYNKINLFTHFVATDLYLFFLSKEASIKSSTFLHDVTTYIFLSICLSICPIAWFSPLAPPPIQHGSCNKHWK